VTLDNAGNLLVLEAGKGVTAYKLDAQGCVGAGERGVQLVLDERLNHGLEVGPTGDVIYARCVFSSPRLLLGGINVLRRGY